MKAASPEQFQFEPTVFGAVRRYPAMVIAVAIVAMAAADNSGTAGVISILLGQVFASAAPAAGGR